jgi:hypothetical protein
MQRLEREVALKDSVIRKHEQHFHDLSHAADNGGYKAEVAALQQQCAALTKQSTESAAAHEALKAELAQAAAQSAKGSQDNAAITELMHLIQGFETKIPKLSSTIARLEAELQQARRDSSLRQAEVEAVLVREMSLVERLQHTEDQLQAAAAATAAAAASRLSQPLPRARAVAPHDAVHACFDGSGNSAWDAAVQRHAVSLVLGSIVERTVARAGARALLQRQPTLADTRMRPAHAAIVHEAAAQAGCSAGDASNVAAAVALDLSGCLEPIARAAGVQLPPAMCLNAVEGMARALLTSDRSAPAVLAGAAEWAAAAADKIRALQLRAVTMEGERDGLQSFKVQVVEDNGRLLQLQQMMQQRHKEVEQAMLASVNDVQQLSQQMGSLLNLIRTKDAENAALIKQVNRLQQHLQIQNDLRLQIEGQKQRLLQYQLLERESLQLKVCGA